ncbi:virulence factor BrkB family protein [Aliidiomarina quisquiliarum]|uniref:virulence factor BrkB family protein n=1 Tax=Aliidiomarina quisquiliarum TaxID=2938947 RepID=UPI00208E3250|nr:virulence factor BrkB family protein [Aliidiomarina quisquiliarum]MCO4322562.1 virulence factor BrkB family protein [Aliidiomarina quisquiliarum]
MTKRQEAVEQAWSKIKLGYGHVWAFSKHFLKRCLKDRVNVTAGHLTYVSLLSLVPLLAVVFAMFAAFPMFAELREQVQEMLLSNLIPTSGDAITNYLEGFVENANQMTAVGAVFLFVVALLLMSAIDKSMNTIWRVEQRRRMIISLAVYWMILTLGPVLVGVSIAASSYLLSPEVFGADYLGGMQSFLLRVLPLTSTFIAFLLLYVTVPNRVVKVRHAIWGALLAAVLFETAKNGFQIYLQYFPTYQLIYGALATIPIMIVWIYLSWNIILIGAELAASIEEYLHEPSEAMPIEETAANDEQDQKE